MNTSKIREFVAGDHEKLEGWFFGLDQIVFFELASMQQQLNIAGDICEVGVFKGKSLAFLSLLRWSDEIIYGFDLFVEDHLETTQTNLEKFGVPENINLTKGLTSDIATENLTKLIARPLRFLHIDAGHEYHEVLEQLLIFSPYLDDRAIIAMDDYQDREFPGVGAAVLDFSERDRPRRFVPFLAGGNKMYLCHVSNAPQFQRFLLSQPNFKDTCRLTRVKDYDVLIARSKLPVASETIVRQITRSRFPRRDVAEMSLADQSKAYAQISFGSGIED